MVLYNEEHLARLKDAINKKDIKLWNRWRILNTNVKPNFRNADLSRSDLRGADLRRAILKKANLQGANLTGAELSKAKLSKADVYGAILNNLVFAQKYFLNDTIFIEYICSEIKSTANWKDAFYDEQMLEQLGLPPDHNEMLREKEENRKKS